MRDPLHIRPILATAALVLLSCIGCSAPGEDPLAGARPADVLDHRPELELPPNPQYDYEPPEPGSYRLPVLEEAADGRVLGPEGEPSALRQLMEGRITVLSFIYTRCNDPRACPMASGVLYTLQHLSREDPLIADNLRLVSMSFDPVHDTPEAMAAYGRRFDPKQGGAEWLFLTTPNRQALEPILEAYGQQVRAKKDPDDPYGPLNHQIRVYLVDREGRIRNIYSLGLMDPRILMTDIRTLLLEELAERGRIS